VLLTNSSSWEARAAADTWKLDAFITNHFNLDAQGCLLGTFEKPLCYGPGKVVRAERWATEHNVELTASYYYADSLSDVPMLARVGNPRVVSPDPRLARVARRRGWQIVNWGHSGTT
jgi:phosphoserine phosphatase